MSILGVCSHKGSGSGLGRINVEGGSFDARGKGLFRVKCGLGKCESECSKIALGVVNRLSPSLPAGLCCVLASTSGCELRWTDAQLNLRKKTMWHVKYFKP